jgi:alpha-tubulin suppressor-like RCC1 family protein
MDTERLASLPIVLMVALAGCGEPTESKGVSTVHVEPATTAILLGASLQLRSIALTATSDTLWDRAVAWMSEAPAIASVGSHGRVVGLRLGDARIVATVDGVSGAATVSVRPVPVRAVEIGGVESELWVAHHWQLTATARDSAGGVLTGRAVIWSSSDSAVASVAQNGIVIGRRPGTATVRAEVESVAASVSVPVIPVPIARIALTPDSTAMAREALRELALLIVGVDSSRLERPVVWSTLTPAVAVDSMGRVTAVAVGTGSVTATVEGLADTTRINVYAARFVDASAGGATACGLTAGGEVYCWGYNADGELGRDSTGEKCWGSGCSTSPVPVGDLPPVAAVSVGNIHVCALTPVGEGYCWGGNDRGQLGRGGTTASAKPEPVSGDLRFASISAGGVHSCGVTLGGALYCWGMNVAAAPGTELCGGYPCATTPMRVDAESDYALVRAGTVHSCAVTTTGRLRCWGTRNSGQVGDGVFSNTPQVTPVDVGLDSIATITAGWAHTCAVQRSGLAWCWGDGGEGQLGDGMATRSSIPVAVSGTGRYSAVAVGNWHTCAVATSGPGQCWGQGTFGQLGVGGTSGATTPVTIQGDALTGVTAGDLFTCGIFSGDGLVYCWGYSLKGQLGNGTVSALGEPGSLLPVRVHGQP